VLAAAALVAAVAAALVGASALATPRTTATASDGMRTQAIQNKICGQIRNGPLTTWSFPPGASNTLGLPRTFKGREWTVFAGPGTTCAFAMKNTPALLRQWVRATEGNRIRPGLPGWLCAKQRAFPNGGRGSPGGGCVNLRARGNLAFWLFGPLTLAQIKRLAATGRLPTR
jgi:hypothetical protein